MTNSKLTGRSKSPHNTQNPSSRPDYFTAPAFTSAGRRSSIAHSAGQERSLMASRDKSVGPTKSQNLGNHAETANPSTEVEVTPEMFEAGLDAYFAVRRYPHDDLFDEEIAARVYRAMRRLDRRLRPDMPQSVSLRSVLERLDRIHSEFERRKQQGLQPPSLRDVDRLFDRP